MHLSFSSAYWGHACGSRIKRIEVWINMKILSRIILLLIIAVIVGGATFLVTWDIPAPTTQIEETIPNSRFN
ncbi:hypothetical protein LPB41_22860 [Thalassospira sp. MA62]|nr:hypothetical protein [Thalassospira sp. MA62]